MVEKKASPEDSKEETPQVTNLDTTSVEVIEAEMVRMHQSAAQEITAEEVALHQSAAFDVTTVEASVHESALALVNAKDVEMTNSAAGAICAENVNVVGQAGIVIAESVNLGNTYAGLVAGGQVRGERIETLILFGNHIEGDVQTVVDTRGALISWHGRRFAGRGYYADRASGVRAQALNLLSSGVLPVEKSGLPGAISFKERR